MFASRYVDEALPTNIDPINTEIHSYARLSALAIKPIVKSITTPWKCFSTH